MVIPTQVGQKSEEAVDWLAKLEETRVAVNQR